MADQITDKERLELIIYKNFFERVEDYPKNAPSPYSGLDYIKARIYDTRYQLNFIEIDPALREGQLNAAGPIGFGDDNKNV